MAVADHKITGKYAVYNGDSIEVLGAMPDKSIDMIIESPPFADLYTHSSSDKDLSNCSTYEQFFEHYEYFVKEQARILKPGRLVCIHCADIPKDGSLIDLPSDIRALYEKHGFVYHDKKTIWKEPLMVAIRTRALGLRQSQIVKDATLCRSAMADYILVMRKRGTNKEPVEHPYGLTEYYGETRADERIKMSLAPIAEGLIEKFKDAKDPKTNKWSHWIWQHYASAVWMDVRVRNVLPYREARESDEERHPHPTQLDCLQRCIQLWSNPGEKVLTSFMGVGSEVFSAVRLGRIGIGVELKTSYYRQAVKNLEMLETMPAEDQQSFDMEEPEPEVEE